VGAQDQAVANNDVGISIFAGEEADAIIELLSEDLGDRLRVTDCLTYMKLETDVGKIEVKFDDVAEVLGHRFTQGDFQAVFASYYGRPSLLDDRMVVSTGMSVGVIDYDG
jgi:hypothetical protein